MSVIVSKASFSTTVRGQGLARKSVAIRNRYILRVLAFLLGGVCLALLCVWVRVRVVQVGYEVTRLHRDVVELERSLEKITASVASLKAPERLEKIANEQFGMRLPLGNEIVFINP